jgi:hypothetical protein
VLEAPNADSIIIITFIIIIIIIIIIYVRCLLWASQMPLIDCARRLRFSFVSFVLIIISIDVQLNEKRAENMIERLGTDIQQK